MSWSIDQIHTRRNGDMTSFEVIDALIGGFDKRVLESGDRDAIRQGVVELTAAMRRNGVRYVFSTDHSISTNVEYEDYQYMLAVFRDHMTY